jgi:preprotein translocase subunit SecF
MNIPFLKYSKIYYAFSGLLAASAVLAIIVLGLNTGLDFTGGSILEINFEQRPQNQIIEEKLGELGLGELVVQPTGDNGVMIRMKEIDESTHAAVLQKLNEISSVTEMRFESIGPTVGKELNNKTLTLVVVSLLALLVYIILAFRRVSFPVSGLKYGAISILALTFDILVTVGILAVLGKFYNAQINISIITALLTILGYTINDKVIVFDRVRENLMKRQNIDFKELVNQSLNQTLSRSLTTGICSLFTLLAIFFFGGDSLKYFSLTLIIGIIVGTYSSLFLASPLLVSWKR